MNNWCDTNTISQTTNLIKKLRNIVVTGRFKYINIKFANDSNTYLILDRNGKEIHFSELKDFVDKSTNPNILPLLEVDNKWSISYDPKNNDLPVSIYKNGVFHSKWDDDLNSIKLSMFYTLLNESFQNENFLLLNKMMGSLHNGTQTKITIYQDDAAMVGESIQLTIGNNTYYGSSLKKCIIDATHSGEHKNSE